MLIIGIDPGIRGAICFFEDGEIKDVIDMPTMASGNKNKKQINGSQIFNEISLRVKAAPKNPIEAPITCPFLTLDPIIGIRITTTRG